VLAQKTMGERFFFFFFNSFLVLFLLRTLKKVQWSVERKKALLFEKLAFSFCRLKLDPLKYSFMHM